MPGRHNHRDHDNDGRHGRRCEERRFARGEDWLEGRGGAGQHGRHRRHGGGRDRHSGRFLEHGDLRFVILDLIASKPRHGYEIIKAIEDAAGGAYSPSPGVVYPTLTMLAELGHAAAAEEEGGRKLYTLTPAGQGFLDQNRAALRAVQARIAEIQASRADEPPAAMVRAMENLKLALRLRLSRGTPSEEQARQIATALDAAALAVEQA